MIIDLDRLSLKDLRELQPQVERAIASYEVRKKKDALAKLEETAKELGFSLNELTSYGAVRKRAPAPPKYANPDDATDTWSGRGRKPRWFAAALAAGTSPDNLMI